MSLDIFLQAFLQGFPCLWSYSVYWHCTGSWFCSSVFPSIHLLSWHISSVLLLPQSHNIEPWQWAQTSLPPLSWHSPWGSPPPGPAFQTHFLSQKWTHFPSKSHLSTFCWLPDLWLLLLLSCLCCSTSLALFSHSQVHTSLLENKNSHNVQSHTWSYKHSHAKTSPFLPPLPPNLHNLSFSCQDQDVDHYFTDLSLSSHLIFFCLFTFLAFCAFAPSLCSSVKCPLFFKALLKIHLSKQHSCFLITGNPR